VDVASQHDSALVQEGFDVRLRRAPTTSQITGFASEITRSR